MFPKKYVTFVFFLKFLFFFTFFFKKTKNFQHFRSKSTMILVEMLTFLIENVENLDFLKNQDEKIMKKKTKMIYFFGNISFPLQLPKSYSFAKSGDYPTNNCCCYSIAKYVGFEDFGVFE